MLVCVSGIHGIRAIEESLDAGVHTEPSALRDTELCRLWNTSAFFELATVDLIEACLERGADIKKTNRKYGFTPLHYAAKFIKDPGVIEVLVLAGADPNAETPMQRTPLHLAVGHRGNVEVIDELVYFGSDPNASDFYRHTPLHVAAASTDDVLVIQKLIELGAVPDAREWRRMTPLHVSAVRNKNVSISKVLIQNDAELDARDIHGWTPLVMAARGANDGALALLVDEGADPISRDRSLRTPLFYVRTRMAAAVLLANGADVNALDNDGNSPLHLAVQEGWSTGLNQA